MPENIPLPENIPIPDAPFLVERRRDAAKGGDFTPSARLILTPALRTSGLWRALPPEELRDLLLVLTFLTPNGHFRPTLLELSEAMRVSDAKARDRMERLAQRRWQGQPVAVLVPRGDSLDAYAPGRNLAAGEDEPPPQEADVPLPPVAGREAVIAFSRAKYARARAEVEAEISERMGWGPPAFDGEDPETADRKRRAYGQMTGLGVPRDQALELLSRFDLDRVERQLGWMPYRNAKSPARFLAAAVENGYDAPPGLRPLPGDEEAGG